MALSAVGFSAMANRLLLVPAPERRRHLGTRQSHAGHGRAPTRRAAMPSPTAAIIDSQSVKATEAAGPRGYDAGKKIMGCKRHILTDTEGHLLSAVVHEACIQDRDGAVLLFSQLFGLFPFISRIFADGGYAGEKLKQALRSFGNWCIEIVKRSDQAKGFVLLPRRFVVERTFAWFGRNRRLSRQFEASPETAVAYLYAASVMLLARRLARSS